MKSYRLVPISALVLAASLFLALPGVAYGQHVKVFDGRSYSYFVPVAPSQEVRVTIANPYVVDPNDPSAVEIPFYLKLHGVEGEATIAPGEAYTYTIDPRTAGASPAQRSRVTAVTVTFSTVVELDEGTPSPQVAVTIELVNTRSGELMSFLAYPGFTGGVRVAAGDVD